MRSLAGYALVPVLFLLGARQARAENPDPWWGKDKALHFSVSVGLSGVGYAGSSFWLAERWQRASAGAGFSLVLGAGKELYDLGGHGDPSWRDFTWDLAGTAVGVMLAWLVDLALFGSPTRPRAGASPLSVPHPALLAFPAEGPNHGGSPALP